MNASVVSHRASSSMIPLGGMDYHRRDYTPRWYDARVDDRAATLCGDQDAVDSASVSRDTNASSCTSTEDVISSSEPSRARAASPALLSMSSAILESRVWAAMTRQAVTGS